MPVVTEGRFNSPEQFENIILRTDQEGAAIVRLGDVGRAEEGLQNYMMRPSLNGKPAVFIAVYQQPGSNALAVAQGVRDDAGATSRRASPRASTTRCRSTRRKFVTASIEEVVHTLLEAVVLVVLVVYVFLQNLRATLIPTLAVVVSIVGTFVGMTLLGFSVNLLTLFGMVLAIGIVVDDAIVVIEAVEANMKTKGLSAARRGVRAPCDEVSGPVVAIVLVLAAVFVPTAFLGGTTGVLYKQFAITVVISVIALRVRRADADAGPRGAAARGLAWPPAADPAEVQRVVRPAHRALRGRRALGAKRATLAVAVFAAFIVAIFGLFRTVPGSFVPPEDQGFMLIAAILPDSASLDRSDAVGPAHRRYRARASGHAVRLGADRLQPARQPVQDQRRHGVREPQGLRGARGRRTCPLDAVIASIRPKLAGISDAIVIPLNPPPIPGLGTQGGFELWVQDLTGGEPHAARAGGAAAGRPARSSARTSPASTPPSTRRRGSCSVKVDREKAETLGAPIADVYGSLQSLFGSLYVSQYNKYGRVWQVVLQAEPEFRSSPEDLRNIFVRGRSGEMVPLDAVTMRASPWAPT